MILGDWKLSQGAKRAPQVGQLRRGLTVSALVLTAGGLAASLPGTAGAAVSPRGQARQLAVSISTQRTVSQGWGQAIAEPGRLNKIGQQYASLTALACPSPGNCLAGGTETPLTNSDRAFTVSQVHGRLQAPVLLTGVAGGYGVISQVTAVACGSAGNCVAGGSYWSPVTRLALPFVDREVNGTWAGAIAIRGLTQTSSLTSQVTSAGCISAGNCLIAGYYFPAPTANRQAFVLRELNGTWRTATPVPGIASRDTARYSDATAVTCVKDTCIVGGFYTVATGSPSTDFLIGESRGSWSAPVSLTGADNGPIISISCSAPGTCAAAGGGDSADRYLSAATFPWVATELSGSWGQAIPVPGTSTDSKFLTGAYSVACPAAGSCAVAGGYWDQSPGIPDGVQAFAASQVNGIWKPARTFRTFVRAQGGRSSTLTAISCSSAGNCVAGGYYTDKWNNNLPILVTEVNGRWGTPLAVPGLALARNMVTAGGEVLALDCPSAAHCVAAGTFEGHLYQQQGFVVTQK